MASTSDAKDDEGRFVGLDEFINNDIESRLQRQTWKQLDLCFKWRLVQKFIDAKAPQNAKELHTELRAMLRTNELGNVEYDGDKITRLNVLGL